MLKETNDMRRLMGLKLLKEDAPKPGSGVVMGAEWQADDKLDKTNIDEEDHDDVVNETDETLLDKKNAYCQEHFDCNYDECTPEQQEKCNKHCGELKEDSEGEETYNYGEDEGADEHREDEMEDELHHDKEEMDPHSRIKAIEDHLDALKKDMGYDEDHEDRDEEGTHFAEGKRYSKVLNTLTESEYKRLKTFINEGEIIIGDDDKVDLKKGYGEIKNSLLTIVDVVSQSGEGMGRLESEVKNDINSAFSSLNFDKLITLFTELGNDQFLKSFTNAIEFEDQYKEYIIDKLGTLMKTLAGSAKEQKEKMANPTSEKKQPSNIKEGVRIDPCDDLTGKDGAECIMSDMVDDMKYFMRWFNKYEKMMGTTNKYHSKSDQTNESRRIYGRRR